MTTFFVGNHRVDMTRCQITTPEEVLTVEPKVIQVLHVLAKHQGEVVSYDTIFELVWPKVKVENNALQRCIAQLRKVFNDDAKQQHTILTYPKKGYSLVQNVHWAPQDDGESKAPSGTATLQGNRRSKLSRNVIFSLLFLSAVIGIAYLWLDYLEEQSLANYTAIKPPTEKLSLLTTTDSKEYNPVYSPNGEYIAFNRSIGSCKNEIWAIHEKTRESFLVTKEPGFYGRPSWSTDGSFVTFSSGYQCDREIPDNRCNDIHQVAFDLAKQSPQQSSAIITCTGPYLDDLRWLSKNQASLLVSDNETSRLVKATFSLPTNSAVDFETILEKTSGDIIAYDYSIQRQEWAVLTKPRSGSEHLRMEFIKDGDFSRRSLELFTNYKLEINPLLTLAWHPSGEAVFLSQYQTLISIDLNGRVSVDSIATRSALSMISFHPSGDKLVGSLGESDLDMVLISTEDRSETTVSRSTVDELYAKFQPHSDNIAFLSMRSGSHQLWLSEATGSQQERVTQLTNLPEGSGTITRFIWSDNGRAIYFIAAGKLHMVGLDKEVDSFDLDLNITNIYQVIDDRYILLRARHKDTNTLYRLDLSNQNYEALYYGFVRAAQMSPTQELFVALQDTSINTVTNTEASTIEALSHIKSWEHFYLRNGALYINDMSKRLWKYDTDSGSLTEVLKFEDGEFEVTDVSDDEAQFLVHKFIYVERDLVVLEKDL